MNNGAGVFQSGLNSTQLVGVVTSFQFGVTANRDEEVCNFTLSIKDKFGHVTWVKVNVFGSIVAECRRHLQAGVTLAVIGEIMNRQNRAKDDMVTEVRCKSIIF